ncbi:molybdate ABC transporter substrate-binding protein [Salinimonas chungwhensis]|uniref:molybdate ABC transporter substrate-binding protein n=1 Tax=Salinimonas chungwhensis TaxID=265425 RepID=UPI00036D0BFC|nr:molybdate ABC transporter substrate-binding protein [Salinimonas chungwhensis]
MKLIARFLTISYLIAAGAVTAQERPPLRLAVAANFAPAVNAVLQSFEQQTGIKATVTVASSGTLFAQLQHGAPFDVFLSADARRPEELVRTKKGVSSTLMAYAQGRLAYVTNDESVTSSDDMVIALESQPRRLAIAHPQLAPYGLAARQTLESVSLWQPYQSQLVRGKNVLQALQYFDTGNVEHALVAASLVSGLEEGKVLIPLFMHQPIVQKAVVPASSGRQQDAMQFLCFILSPAIQQQFARRGYGPVDSPDECRDEQ